MTIFNCVKSTKRSKLSKANSRLEREETSKKRWTVKHMEGDSDEAVTKRYMKRYNLSQSDLMGMALLVAFRNAFMGMEVQK